MVTTTSMTAVSVSTLSAQSMASVPDEIQVNTGTRSTSLLPKPTVKNDTQESSAATIRKPEVMISAAREPSAAGSWSCPSPS